MRKLPEVQQAKELMNEAREWSTFKWLWEKSRVRETADHANAALDKLERSVKAKWSEEFRAAHKQLTARTPAAAGEKESSAPPPAEVIALLERVAEADHAAKRARADAEKTFADAEKHMSISLACQGCKKAIHSWELKEKAIRTAEAVVEAKHEQV